MHSTPVKHLIGFPSCSVARGAELHLFDEQGQSASLEKNRAELWTRIELFLERHIGQSRSALRLGERGAFLAGDPV